VVFTIRLGINANFEALPFKKGWTGGCEKIYFPFTSDQESEKTSRQGAR
jgi:hypothetical protein